MLSVSVCEKGWALVYDRSFKRYNIHYPRLFERYVVHYAMPKTTNKLLSALAPWNAWHGPSPFTGIPRDITLTLLSLMGEKTQAPLLANLNLCGR